MGKEDPDLRAIGKNIQCYTCSGKKSQCATSSDPGEETDVSGRHPEKVAALQERVSALLADMRTSYQPNRYRGACFSDTGNNILFYVPF